MAYYSRNRTNNNNNNNNQRPRRHSQGYNPFLDNQNENERHQATINECKMIQGLNINPSNNNHLNNEIQNNPYCNNDPYLTAAQSFFNKKEDEKFLNDYAIDRSHSNGGYPSTHNGYHSHHNNTQYNDPNVISPQHLDEWYNDPDENEYHHIQTRNYKNSANSHENNQEPWNVAIQNETDDKIVVKSDNPYHPTHYYKDNDDEQRTATSLVSKYRVSPKDAIKADAVQNEYMQFLNSLEAMEEAKEMGYAYNDKFNYQENGRPQYSPKHNVGVDDIIPGQEMINPHNFNTLRKDDTVWIRNDEGDWEIFSVIAMEKTGDYNVGTFKTAKKELRIWEEQTEDEFVMARYIPVKEGVIMENMYAINNIFKIKMNGMNGNFVLKGYDKTNGMAQLKCVKTGEMHTLNLNEVEHKITGV